MEKKRAVGYVRVSSQGQAKDGESLNTQRADIKSFILEKDWDLVDVIGDEGISGKSIKNRLGLQAILSMVDRNGFDVLVIHRISRLARNVRELLNIIQRVEENGAEVRFIKEQIDTTDKYGRAWLTMLGTVAQLEREIISEQTRENRIARGRQKIPTAGRLPYGRTYDKVTGEWGIDEKVAQFLRWAAKEYLAGGSLKAISNELKTRHNLPLGYNHLITVLSKRCGDTWTITFKGEEPIVYDIPRILEDETIQAIRGRLRHNKAHNRVDVRRYVLTGFIRCSECGKALAGQTQKPKSGTQFKYYRHSAGKWETCKAMSSIPLEKIESAVFSTIFENTHDELGFQAAIKSSLPDTEYVDGLKRGIEDKEGQIKKIDSHLARLVEFVLNGDLRKETVQKKEQDLYSHREKLSNELAMLKGKLNGLPDPEDVKREGERIRLSLLDYFGSRERFLEMSFEEKKQLLHWLFDGKDEDGNPYGIFITRKGKQQWDYYISAKLFAGERTLKGHDIDHWDGDGGERFHAFVGYKTNSLRCFRLVDE